MPGVSKTCVNASCATSRSEAKLPSTELTMCGRTLSLRQVTESPASTASARRAECVVEDRDAGARHVHVRTRRSGKSGEGDER